jgi:hypothetical protein
VGNILARNDEDSRSGLRCLLLLFGDGRYLDAHQVFEALLGKVQSLSGDRGRPGEDKQCNARQQQGLLFGLRYGKVHAREMAQLLKE